jgi:hypothetical protein
MVELLLGRGPTRTSIRTLALHCTGRSSGPVITGTNVNVQRSNHLASDGRGFLYVADTVNEVVRRVDMTTANVTTYATGVFAPYGMAFGPDGALWVTNQKSNVIIRVPPGGGMGSVTAGSPFSSLNTDGTVEGGGGMWNPVAIVVEPGTGALIVSTAGNKQTIRKITLTRPVSPFCDGKYHHLALSYSGSVSDSTFRLYFDGSLFSTALPSKVAATNYNAPRVVLGSGAVRIGWNGDASANGGDPFVGSVSDLRIYSTGSIPAIAIPYFTYPGNSHAQFLPAATPPPRFWRTGTAVESAAACCANTRS